MSREDAVGGTVTNYLTISVMICSALEAIRFLSDRRLLE
jgi:hypothetical protein